MSEKDYKNTLNLPNTDFPMKANLPEKEPAWLKQWEEEKIYEKVIEKNKNLKNYTLHDGPPYANGKIHLGTALNKILKDIVVRYKNMNGFCAPYIPGWDCHGLPIELQVEKQFGKTDDINVLIKRCRDYAAKYIEEQKAAFKRLGVYGEWNNPYLTMNKSYEASIVREFAKIVEKGAVYRADKPVYWCSDCGTALAEAEVEYKDHLSHSIFVKFKITDESKKKLNLEDKDAFVIIWTTTPWTLPANLAITLHPDFNYGAYETDSEVWIVAEDLLENFKKEIKKEFKKLYSYKGSDFNLLETLHPFYNRKSLLINGEHVTLETGTGCVHTAPGHGMDDYIVGKKYGIEIYNPVNSEGKFYKDVELVGGKSIYDANTEIIEIIKNNGSLIYTSKVKHSYPHCWRCKKPIIFRATPQWFISMNNLREKALSEITNTTWTPSKGMKRIYSMVENRPDWCISRQRRWGVPIIYFICKDCNETITDTKIINKVADLIEKEGIEAWHNLKTSDLINSCPKCSSKNIDKGKDILDVWFDSGVSHAAVVEKNKNLKTPVDLYLEGSDQHRGWFHTSLLESVLTRGVAPYKQVVTHGFIVDKNGYKMSKSLGNVVDPIDLVNKAGSDILRLWTTYEDFSEDISYSEESYARITEAYRRIRNTFRFILGNLYDFDNKKDKIEYEKLREIDKLLIHKLQYLIKDIKSFYENFEFYKIYHSINNFCVNELSSFYLDISKDILYANKANSYERRSIQTTMYEILTSMLKLIAPILIFTSEETWKSLKEKESVHLSDMPNFEEAKTNKNINDKWEKIIALRQEITKVLEEKRQNKIIGHSLDASVELYLNKELISLIENIDMESMLIVSNVKIYESKEFKIEVSKSSFGKCKRCWQYKKEVNEKEEICQRCLNAIS